MAHCIHGTELTVRCPECSNGELLPVSLDQHIAQAIDRWRHCNPDVTVMEILSAMESIRHVLTEGLIGK